MNKSLYVFALILSSLLVPGCSSTEKAKISTGLEVDFTEFQKIISPRSLDLIEGKNSALTVLALPGDKYPKLYLYDFATEKFSLEYDHGSGISGVGDDRSGLRTYLHIDNKGDENTQIYLSLIHI